MNKLLTILVTTAFCTLPLRAQDAVVLDEDIESNQLTGIKQLTESEPLTLLPLTERGTIGHFPYSFTPFSGLSDWSLHPGLNGSLSASVGWNKYWGTGFSNSISLMHANLLAPRLSYAVGVHSSHLSWGPYTVNDAGLTAMLGYRLDEHWEACLFAQKSLVQPRVLLPYYMADDIGDKIGASIRYNVSPAFSVQLSVWEGRRPEPRR